MDVWNASHINRAISHNELASRKSYVGNKTWNRSIEPKDSWSPAPNYRLKNQAFSMSKMPANWVIKS
ncbi:2196_t:CDS:2 [Paraglomus brasilianum]|uniref:2196_t:CDS:1 n=1 Tax=Paraglomus brasilianum TaxID=144538 RepID=A0A9N9GEN3_9GLOM|nr:2196_t:CDS:2 [Paraglomus brasilianum]